MNFDGPIGPDLSHPDAMIRLASAIHRFPCPEMVDARKLSFVKSFQTVGQHTKTKALTKKADQCRTNLSEQLSKSHSSSGGGTMEAVSNAAQEYLPHIHSILTSCKVQSENAQLDQRLLFQWSSGLERKPVEKKKKKKQDSSGGAFTSEALMFELVMVLASHALGTAGMACDESVEGNFAAAGRGFKKAAGVMRYLAENQLPQWIAKGSANSTKEDSMPSETNVGVCSAMSTFFLAVAQQMAVATVLIKPGTPNWSLLAKLTLGVAEQMEDFIKNLRAESATHMTRIDPGFLTLVTFQTNLYREALCPYFLARATWDLHDEYGLAIAMLNEARQGLKTRDSAVSKGLPELGSTALRTLEKDLVEFRQHVQTLLTSWESDNSRVYFTRVPTTVPEDRKIAKGVHMMKPDDYALAEAQLVHLGPLVETGTDAAAASAASTEDSDEALARAMQERLNRGEMD